MHHVYAWLRRHQTLVDSVWAFFFLVACGFNIVADQQGVVHAAVLLVVTVPFTLVVALRRRYPVGMFLLALATGVFQLVDSHGPYAGDVALLLVAYTAAAAAPRRYARIALVASALAGPLSSVRWPDTDSDTHGVHVVTEIVSAVFVSGIFLLAWVLGDSVRTRRAYLAELEDRAARLERERDARAHAAAAAERARIARELHDVVAHNVSVMVVQADGAAYVLDGDPAAAGRALATIAETGRSALAEMRRLLGVLRAKDADREYLPQPDVGQLDELLDQVRGAGLAVDFAVDGERRPLPPGVELTAYRIVQEALTNTRKHAGPHASARVLLRYGEDALTMLIEDDGRGADGALTEQGGADRLGHGLIGMRERVGMVGGRLVVGPRPRGGFRVSAELPLHATALDAP